MFNGKISNSRTTIPVKVSSTYASSKNPLSPWPLCLYLNTICTNLWVSEPLIYFKSPFLVWDDDLLYVKGHIVLSVFVFLSLPVCQMTACRSVFLAFSQGDWCQGADVGGHALSFTRCHIKVWAPCACTTCDECKDYVWKRWWQREVQDTFTVLIQPHSHTSHFPQVAFWSRPSPLL